MTSGAAITRVGLLRMDDLPESGVHVRGDYPALYAHLFRDQPVELLDIAVHEGEVPASLDDADVWVLTGSRYSVYDDIAWIANACELTRTLIAEERPTVGICFGHQLFGQALGGLVERANGWEIGAQYYTTIAPNPWFADAPDGIFLLASHRDQVVAPPPDARVWSAGRNCPIAGMTIGERAWSVQGHPEFTADVAQALYEGRRATLGDESVDAAASTLNRPLSNASVAAAIVATAGG